MAKCDRGHIVRDFIDAAGRALNLRSGCRNQSLTVAKCPPPAILRFTGPALPPPGPFIFGDASSNIDTWDIDAHFACRAPRLGCV